MSNVAIRLDGIGKKYRIRHQPRERYVALRDVITDRVRGLLRPRPAGGVPPIEDFWALRDISFEVERGEVVGVIGRNGAGKSTLLKILSRITEPTEGRASLDGRVASILEVGTGFHPELTGRENIYLNGAVLGMRRVEINRRFDEIVAFSGVENFLDTPVKRFSSGMYMRLAFAVAAHLETENLIVDEVLAVGDADFQRKCLGKISEIAEGGRTVLFVSHNMAAIRRLTRRCILLDGGRIRVDASVDTAIDLYLTQAADGLTDGFFVRGEPPPGNKPFFVRRVTTRRTPDTDPASQFDCDHPFFICIDYMATRRVPGLRCWMQLQRSDGTVVYEGDSLDAAVDPLDDLSAGEGTLSIGIPSRVLGSGTYQIVLTFVSGLDPAGPEIDRPGVVGQFVVDDTRTPSGNRRHGFLSTILDWRRTGIEPVSARSDRVA
ncbi:MAG TPA: polysaccharide ABC transporter ATP-binding protein [Stellaceae bacterium]|nr:polysaccharide ABC transporter ATP-binding protein [Stellaceae bacterium]